MLNRLVSLLPEDESESWGVLLLQWLHRKWTSSLYRGTNRVVNTGSVDVRPIPVRNGNPMSQRAQDLDERRYKLRDDQQQSGHLRIG